jgi:hypothetical protein
MDNTKRKFNYSMVRVVCRGEIKSCDFCKIDESDESCKEGYCHKCGRPLWKKPGEECGFIVGYLDHNYRQQNKVHFKCKFCNTVTTA